MVLLSTFRLPTQIHTRSANAKRLDSSPTPTCLDRPGDAARFGVGRTVTWCGWGRRSATSSLRPDHQGTARYRLQPPHGTPALDLRALRARGADGTTATVDLRNGAEGGGSSAACRPDRPRPTRTPGGSGGSTRRPPELTFPVHLDPIPGTHCWHQAVRAGSAALDDRHGDIAADTVLAHEVFPVWLARPARPGSSPPTVPVALLWPIRPQARR